MVKYALYVHLQAKPGKEADVEAFLASALPLVQEEKDTVTWYAMKMGNGNYGIFDTFAQDDGREAHLNGAVAAALMQKADELFAEPPKISKVDLISAKVPG